MESSTEERQHLLKIALLGNACFSAISGLLLVFAQRSIVRFLGLSEATSLAALGIGLIAFAVVLVFYARKRPIRLLDAWIAVVMDLAWVIGSYPLIFMVPFSSGGKWVVGIVAEIVMFFALLQWIGIRRIRKAKIAPQLSH